MSLISYYTAQITVCSQDERVRLWALRFGVIFDLTILGWFKYAMFIQDNVNGILTFANTEPYSTLDIILPIGISFHTFQSISYIIDIYRRDAPPAPRLVDFLAFGALFPQLIAGPVLRYKDLAEQFMHRTHSLELFTQGMYRFILGLAMKVLVADSVAPLADRMFSLPNPSMPESWLGALAYTIQLFFDFAGYSAMAIGLGLMIGFRFIENFNAPYISRSITEFWQRWHISLSTWLRDYLYIPLGGNRHGPRRTYINLILTMVLGGFWHGANWTFILWGIWHGGIMAVERAMGAKHAGSVWPRAIAWPLTMIFVILGWVLFRAPDVAVAFDMYQGMFGAQGFSIRPDIAWAIRPSELAMLGVGIAICMVPFLPNALRRPLSPQLMALVMSVLMLGALTRMASQSYSPFLYFQF
ncbi:MBOAT family O-acyltransferase [Monaibacterium marinum]|nr:MBOAT family protein [Monaibacterium marinum]